MERSLASNPAVVPKQVVRVPAVADLGLIELRTATPLAVRLRPDGALFSIRHRETLINQLLPGPAEDGLFRLLARVHGPDGKIRHAPAVGSACDFAVIERSAAFWTAVVDDRLECTTELKLHPRLPAWAWTVRMRNMGEEPVRADVLIAHDLGLGDEAAVRNNEAYNSHYLDLLPVRDPAMGWVVMARQNQPAAGGRHPWLGLACMSGAAAYCTDGWQFFGHDHRLTGEPAAVRTTSLPSLRMQYECALSGLQSQMMEIESGATAQVVFVARFLDDHPAASSADDLVHLREIVPIGWAARGGQEAPAVRPVAASLFVTAGWAHGDRFTTGDWSAWFPGPWRNEERDKDGVLLSFFCGDNTHVVSRDKEAIVARPHGHILRSGDASWIDDTQFGLTGYAAGLFAAQVYLGNPSFARLLPVVRNALNVIRGTGQQVFVHLGDEWKQLGLPSAFAMSTGEARWIYRLGGTVVEARVWCSSKLSASFLELRVSSGGDLEFLITHQLVLGASEYEHGGVVNIHEEAGWAGCLPDTASLVGRHMAGTSFAIAAANPRQVARIGGEEMLRADHSAGTGGYLVFQTRPVACCGMIMTGSLEGQAALPAAVQAARDEFVRGETCAQPPALPFRFSHCPDPASARVAEVLPWFNHNAAIHFAAPHGLEQYGGAAWGVRDVCQGSVEWLLASARFETVRHVLEVVFAQQYADGSWPQWFMHPPYRFIQQPHSHGDVCFWPVKALCDYVEASNDMAFLHARLGYTDARQFGHVGPEETLLAHCDRVVAHVESRFMSGTALVNYGDGDWDDTLQPADPTLRTRMVSAWTVALSFHVFGQLAVVCARAGAHRHAARVQTLLARIRQDFHHHLMPGGVVAGFLVTQDEKCVPLLHPHDTTTGIRHRLLPMTRAVIAELFSPEEAFEHLDIIERELRYPDGVRLMSEPAAYRGGREHLFKRADTAANVGREIGLQYVHAHLRYAEALAKVGDAEGLWRALQVVNPVGLAHVVPNAAIRQSNVYFSSSDAAFPDRYEAAAHWQELRDGRVPVLGGWRLYSSGPGLFLHKVRSCLLGVRESFDDIVFDPVLPRSLDGLSATMSLCRRTVRMTWPVNAASFGPSSVAVNGIRVEGIRESNPYRMGGLRVSVANISAHLREGDNTIVIEL